MTPLRRWIKKTLIGEIPFGTITQGDSTIICDGVVWSDTNPTKFRQLTEVTHKELLAKWYQLNPDGSPIDNTNGTDPSFTTCTSFLSCFSTRINNAGGINSGRVFRPFKMNGGPKWKDKKTGVIHPAYPPERGWVPVGSPEASAQPAQEGDFYLLLNPEGRYSQIWCMGKFGLGGDILLLIFTIIRFIQNRYPILKLYSSSHFR